VIINRVDYSAGATGVVEAHSFLPYSSSHCSVSLSRTASSSAVQFCTSLPAIHFVVPITFGCAARMLCLAPAARQSRCVTIVHSPDSLAHNLIPRAIEIAWTLSLLALCFCLIMYPVISTCNSPQPCIGNRIQVQVPRALHCHCLVPRFMEAVDCSLTGISRSSSKVLSVF